MHTDYSAIRLAEITSEHRVEGYINEYPVGAYNFEEINVTEVDDV